MDQVNIRNQPSNNPDLSIDLRDWGYKVLSFWWLFAICLLISVLSGYLYLRYADNEYLTKTKVLIKGAGKGGSLSELAILGENLGISSNAKDLNNEMEIFASRPILTKTVERIGAQVSYFRIGKLKNTELYNLAPFFVEAYALKHGLNTSFFVDFGYHDDFVFKKDEGDEGQKQILGENFENEFGTFLISRSTEAKLVPGLYQVRIQEPENVAESYKRKLEIQVVGAQHSSSILEFRLQDQSPEKSVAFLNTLVESYNENQRTDNVAILNNTIEFIDKRIEVIEDELRIIEKDLEDFKISNKLVSSDVNSSIAFVLPELRAALRQQTNYEIELELLKSVTQDLNYANNEDKLIPANVAQANPGLSDLINQYNKLILERKRLKQNITSESPVLFNLENDIEDYKGLIVISLENVIEGLKIPIASVEATIKELQLQTTDIPEIEKLFSEKLRIQSLKEDLYLHLLQRKEEAELSRAVTTANTRVVETAKSTRGPVYPQKKIVRLGSVIIGLLVPMIIIFIMTLLDNKIASEASIQTITTIPIIGKIPRIKLKEIVVATKITNSIIIEAFRLIRTNLDYMNVDNQKQVLMTTSSTSSEGKSVVSINLALTIAHANKKVVLLDMDMRKSKMRTYLKSNLNVGVSNVLAGLSELKSVIQIHEEVENFHYVMSGPTPPNAAELLQSNRMTKLINELSNEYDVILLDCPPIGPVADALLLRKYVTNTLYLVRSNYTRKQMIRHLEQLNTDGELVKPMIVLNDVKYSFADYRYGNYNYGY